MLPAHRPSTLQDVAQRAGVHTATASRALNIAQQHRVHPDTLERVQNAAAELRYRTNAVAQSLRRGATGTLGVVVADLANPFISQFLRGIESVTQPRQVFSLIAETGDRPERLRRVCAQLLNQRVDALIVTASHLGDSAFIEQLARETTVVLAIREVTDVSPRQQADRPYTEVMNDDEFGANLATAHLLELGHRRLAELRGSPVISSFVHRSHGYQRALAAHPHAIDLTSHLFAAESTVAEGYRMTTEILAAPPHSRPTALFAHNDLLAVGAIQAIREHGLKCPEDISVVGYNNVPLADQLQPPLTTVSLPAYQMGQQSAQICFNRLSDPHQMTLKRTVLTPTFHTRGSTAAPPKPKFNTQPTAATPIQTWHRGGCSRT